ncbi:hypothetical protein [Trinickia mobilis]|uniref:hypothetical protein n=1 Tax=Trinickia mobilis TaxID=2816356 RepID=UPI001A8E08CA
MDIGIAGRTALVFGASQELGFACVQDLAREGVHLVIAARRRQLSEDAEAPAAIATKRSSFLLTLS